MLVLCSGAGGVHKLQPVDSVAPLAPGFTDAASAEAIPLAFFIA